MLEGLKHNLLSKNNIVSLIAASAVVGSMVSSIVVPSHIAMANPGASMSVNPETQAVDPGDTFALSAYIWSDEDTMSAQTGLRFDPDVLECLSVANGGYYSGGLQIPTNPNIDNDNGEVEVTMVGLLGAAQGPGEGDFLVYEFEALQDGVANIELLDVIISNADGQAIGDLTVNNGQVVVGTPPLSDLVVIEKLESWIEEGVSYNVNYTVENQGQSNASASTTSINIDDGQSMSDSVGELAPGDTHSAIVGPFNFSTPSDTITVTADSAGVVDESNENNNTMDNDLYYATSSASGDTPVVGSVPPTFVEITVPGQLDIPLEQGETNVVQSTVEIESNQPWQLNASDEKTANKGHMTNADASNVLANSLKVQGDAALADLETGGMIDQDAGDKSASIELQQYVEYTDLPDEYGITVTFTVLGML
ncbi:MAG: CARDB domain-containing protein [Chloroflexota bacterium]|nr:CARDB domain-containing protein [Chloroflexota bacterium]